MHRYFPTGSRDRTAQDGIKCDKTAGKGIGKPMMDEIIAALRALANIFDLISRNVNKRK